MAGPTARSRVGCRDSCASPADEIAFPDYDGNGMFKSLGNLLVNPNVGLLFIDLHERPRRLRVNGEASVSREDPLLAQTVGAQMIVRVKVRAIFPNCPRYIPKMQLVEPSMYAPQPGERSGRAGLERLRRLQGLCAPATADRARRSWRLAFVASELAQLRDTRRRRGKRPQGPAAGGGSGRPSSSSRRRVRSSRRASSAVGAEDEGIDPVGIPAGDWNRNSSVSAECSHGTWRPPVAAITSLRTSIMSALRPLPPVRMLPQQRCRERRVAPLPVVGHVARLGGEGDEHAGPGLHGSQAAREGFRAHAHGAREIAGQRVVAAGVEHDDADLAVATALQLPQDELEAHGLEIEIPLALELGIDGQEMIAVPPPASRGRRRTPTPRRHRQCDGRRCARPRPGARLSRSAASVTAKPSSRRARAHVLGVVGGVLERGRVAVAAHADDERDAARPRARRRHGTASRVSRSIAASRRVRMGGLLGFPLPASR